MGRLVTPGSRVRTGLGEGLGTFGRILPNAGCLGAALGLVWIERGSIAAVDWLPYAVGVALLLAVVLLSGAARLPSRLALAGVGALAALAVWSAVSAAWSPVPGLARDEGLLVLLYAFVLAIPASTLASAPDRLRATGLLVATAGGAAAATALALRLADDPERFYAEGRLSYPISYANALAAFFVIAFWPAVAIAARRSAAPASRALATGAAALVLGAWLSTQSKGAALGLAVSAVVFFAASPQRLRAAVPFALAAGPVAAAGAALTGPYRVDGEGPVRDAGTALLAAGIAAAVAGAVYAVLDARVELRPRTRRVVARSAAALLVAVVVAGAIAAVAAAGTLREVVADQWETFTTNRDVETETHLGDIGSNRYDYWRVELEQIAAHPVAGVGARGFGSVYLVERTRAETPRRGHSLPLDALMELGVVGFALLAVGVGAPLAAAARSVRRASAAAALAGCTGWLAHSAVDWTWTLPAAAVPFFVLLGIGCADSNRPLGARPARVAGVVAVVAAFAVLAPPWIAARLVATATEPADLRWAQRLDPISAEPYLAEARLTPAPANVEPYRRAAEREPRRSEVRYEYGLSLFAAGRLDEAREEFRAAVRLWPDQEAYARALELTR